MKKFLILFFLFLISPSFAASTVTGSVSSTNWSTANNLNRVNTIGKNLLQKNGLKHNITFKIKETEDINAYANGNNEIYVYTGLLKYVNNDSELAGVIAHEIGHILNSHVAKQTILDSYVTTAISYTPINNLAKTGALLANKTAMLKMSRVEEYEADITGIDLMTEAGYSPLAMVSFLYKLGGNYKDFFSDHPSCDKRTLYSYNYIAYAYPEKAKENYTTESFKQFLSYATPIINARNADPNKLKKFNKKQEKLKNKRLKKLAKYKQSSGSSFIDLYYKSLTTE